MCVYIYIYIYTYIVLAAVFACHARTPLPCILGVRAAYIEGCFKPQCKTNNTSTYCVRASRLHTCKKCQAI